MKRFFSFAIIIALMFVGFFGFVPAKSVSAKETEFQRGGTPAYSYYELVYYDDKDQDANFIMPNALPMWASSYTCGITAGGVIVGKYQKDYTDLIPNHTPGITFLGQWIWNGTNANTTTMFDTLYANMNATSNGVTKANYLSGLNTYATNKGCTFESTSLMSGGSVNFAAVKTALHAGKLLSIFTTTTFNLTTPASYSGFDQLAVEVYNGNHIMVVYGYFQVLYLDNQNVNFRTDTYLRVHTTFGGSLGFIRINANVVIDDVMITHISQ